MNTGIFRGWAPAALLLIAAAITLIWYFTVQNKPANPEPETWPTFGWAKSTPEEQGFDSGKLAEGLLAIRRAGIDVHSLVMVRRGKLFLEAYFYPYDGSTVHELASVTKSMMTTLVGIAAGEGLLSLDDPLLGFFPGRTIANRDARKQSILVRHLASMSSGLECTAAQDEATLREMRTDPNWSQFILDKPVVSEPGKQFVYCSPAIHLLSPILQQASGQTALEYFQQHLAEPMGISEVLWRTDPQGYNRGSEGIYLTTPDLAKFGLLWLQKGAWDGRQLVPQDWVEQAVSVQMEDTGDDDLYGYGWWVSPGDVDTYSMIGRGGQRLLVAPSLDLVIAMTGGGCEWDELEPFILPAIGDMEKPLAPNPQGEAALAEAAAKVIQPPEPSPQPDLPALAMEISGKTYAFEPNPSNIERFTAYFDGSPQAELKIKFSGIEEATWPVGLDGVYRLTEGDFGLPQGARGEWTSPDTFVLEYDNIANNDHVFLTIQFSGERVIFDTQETAHEGGFSFEGRLQEP